MLGDMKALALAFLESHGFTTEYAVIAERGIKAGQFPHGDEVEGAKISEIALIRRMGKNLELHDYHRPCRA